MTVKAHDQAKKCDAFLALARSEFVVGQWAIIQPLSIALDWAVWK
jgi:hypothetical protein